MKHSKSILVIDDDDAIQTLMKVVLLRRGFAVYRARDGEEALSELRLRKYDLLLLDLMMPKVNGFEVLRELRSLFPYLLKRTVVFTAVSDATLQHFDENQVFRLVRKPFDINTLVNALDDCLAAHESKRRRARKLAPDPASPPAAVPASAGQK